MKYNVYPFFDPFFVPKRNPMNADLSENDSGYSICAELPGFKKEDIALSVKDGSLFIRAKKEEEKEEKGKYLVKECIRGDFVRSFYFGDWLEEDLINASFKDGMLKIEIRKEEKEEEKPKLIEIR